MVYNIKIGKVYIIEFGVYGVYLVKGVVVFDIKMKKKIIMIENLFIKGVLEDEELVKKYEYVDKKFKEYVNEVVGEVIKIFIDRFDFIIGEEKIIMMFIAVL